MLNPTSKSLKETQPFSLPYSLLQKNPPPQKPFSARLKTLSSVHSHLNQYPTPFHSNPYCRGAWQHFVVGIGVEVGGVMIEMGVNR